MIKTSAGTQNAVEQNKLGTVVAGQGDGSADKGAWCTR